MTRSIISLVWGLVLLLGASAYADDPGLTQLYGSGVHAYFSGDYLAAYDDLTKAIEGGSLDPRCYYYRGLTFIRLGREPEARTDFAQGAELESRDADGFYDVATSLERIQGATRLELEQYRVDARLAARQRAEAVRKARYEAVRAEESRVVSGPIESASGGGFEIFVAPDAEEPPRPTESVPVQTTPPQPPAEPFGIEPGELHLAQPEAGPSAQPGSGHVLDALLKAVGKALPGEGPGPGAPTSTPPPGEVIPLPEEPSLDPFDEMPPSGPAEVAPPSPFEPSPAPASVTPPVPPTAEPPGFEPAIDPFSSEPSAEPPGAPAAPSPAPPPVEPAAPSSPPPAVDDPFAS